MKLFFIKTKDLQKTILHTEMILDIKQFHNIDVVVELEKILNAEIFSQFKSSLENFHKKMENRNNIINGSKKYRRLLFLKS